MLLHLRKTVPGIKQLFHLRKDPDVNFLQSKRVATQQAFAIIAILPAGNSSNSGNININVNRDVIACEVVCYTLSKLMNTIVNGHYLNSSILLDAFELNVDQSQLYRMHDASSEKSFRPSTSSSRHQSLPAKTHSNQSIVHQTYYFTI